MTDNSTIQAITFNIITPLEPGEPMLRAANQELVWLFAAADHALSVFRGEIEAGTPIPVDIPSTAETLSQATNAILLTIDDFSMQLAQEQIDSLFKQIEIYLRGLNIELEKQAKMGGETGSGLALMNSIRAQRKAVVECLGELARLMKQIYGVKITSPDKLVELF